MKYYVIFFLLFLFFSHVLGQEINCDDPLNHEKGCGPCNTTEDCGGYRQGICIENICKCTRKYYGPNCDGKRKDKTIAFLLTFMVGPLFFLPPGAGRLYLEYWEIGIGQLILGLGWVILIGPLTVMSVFVLFSWIISDSKKDIEFYAGFLCFCGHSLISLVIVVLMLMSATAAIIWWTVDWIMILNNSLDDANGHKLSSW